MNPVKQVILFFKEANADKVYEIDLCETGNELYVVNFRYGKRNTLLKEGVKTETPVALQKATAIFDALEAEKRAKGYYAEGETSVLTAPVIPIITDWKQWLEGRKKAIVQRLDDAVNETNSFKTPWKLPRVIWMAGVQKITEAVLYSINLSAKGDTMQQYACAWRLCKTGNKQAIPALKYLHNSSSLNIKRIANEGFATIIRWWRKNTVS